MKLDTNTVLMVLGALYLANLGFGIVEFIPDNSPIIGHLDELVASYLVLRGVKV